MSIRGVADKHRVVHDGKSVAHHLRSIAKGSETLVLDHYLEILVRSRGAARLDRFGPGPLNRNVRTATRAVLGPGTQATGDGAGYQGADLGPAAPPVRP